MAITYINENNLKRINSENVINYQQIVSNDIICLICKNIVFDPVTCNTCQKLFCTICIEGLKVKNAFCPNKESFHKIEIIEMEKPNIKLKSISMKCIYFLRGCKNEISYENYSKHINNCEYKLCKCDLCEYITVKKYMDNHKCGSNTCVDRDECNIKNGSKDLQYYTFGEIIEKGEKQLNEEQLDYELSCYCGMSFPKSWRNHHFKECQLIKKLCDECKLIIKSKKILSNNESNKCNQNNESTYPKVQNNKNSAKYRQQINDNNVNNENADVEYTNGCQSRSRFSRSDNEQAATHQTKFQFSNNNSNSEYKTIKFFPNSNNKLNFFSSTSYDKINKSERKIKDVISKFANKNNDITQLGFFLTGNENTFKKSHTHGFNFTNSFINVDLNYESKFNCLTFN